PTRVNRFMIAHLHSLTWAIPHAAATTDGFFSVLSSSGGPTSHALHVFAPALSSRVHPAEPPPAALPQRGTGSKFPSDQPTSGFSHNLAGQQVSKARCLNWVIHVIAALPACLFS